MAKEVTAGRGLGITFRQLTDGKHFIQLIYDEDDKISDCEYQNQKQSVTDFISTFTRDKNLLQSTNNSTLIVALKDQHQLPYEFKHWMNYTMLRNQCKKKHHELKKLLKNRKTHHFESEMHQKSHKKNGPSSSLKNNLHELKHNNENSTHKHRHKRDTTFGYDKSDNYLLFPGTLWCGRSDAAHRYTSLGMMSGTDKCCRKHDYCKNNIPGFSYRHGMFNKRPFTLSECRCDMSFRACLKRVGSSDANLVGKLFFNVVQTKCFVFKPKKTCIQRSWWGKCQKKTFKKQAVLRDNMPY